MNYNYKERRNYKEEQRYFDSIASARIKCKKCGHTILMSKVDRTICSYCGHWVYKNSKTEFKYKLQEVMKKDEN